MSLERAFVNCGRCYDIAGYIARENANSANPPASEVIPRKRVHSDSLWYARNEAMRALESEDVELADIALEALKACVTCNYRRPEIRKVITKRTKEHKTS